MGTTSEHREGVSQHAIWNDVVGDAWVKYAAVHDRQAEPFGRAVLDALGDLTGARVLDVGCGTGATSNQLIVRGAVDVLGVDLSAPMINAGSAATSAQVRLEVGDVTELTSSEPFDVVYSRFGVMFFEDPVAAFTHLRALATETARLGFCCWGQPFDNPVMTLPVMASAAVLGPPRLAGPGEPGPFSLATRESIEQVLAAAGWAQITITELALDPPHPAGNAEAVAEMSLEFNPLLVDGLRRSPAKRSAARDAIVDALRPFERDGVVYLGLAAQIVTATAAR